MTGGVVWCDIKCDSLTVRERERAPGQLSSSVAPDTPARQDP